MTIRISAMPAATAINVTDGAVGFEYVDANTNSVRLTLAQARVTLFDAVASACVLKLAGGVQHLVGGNNFVNLASNVMTLYAGTSGFKINNSADSLTLATLSTAGALTLTSGITTGATTLHTTTVALTNTAAAATATMTNAPMAGNPTKWIVISDNGTPRSIPAW